MLSLGTTSMEDKKANRHPGFRLPAIMSATENSSSPSLPDVTSSHHATDDTANSFTLCQFFDDGIETFEEVTKADVTTLTEFAPCPDYESCTPMPANVLQGDDSDDMPFIPFADDPKFDSVEHCKEYSRFAWQVINVDPDCGYSAPARPHSNITD